MELTHRPWVDNYMFSLDVHERTALFVPYSYCGPYEAILALLYDITILAVSGEP